MIEGELKIKDKKIFICEEHHHVLTFWNAFKKEKPYLLTFDYHTDVHWAFQSFLSAKNYASEIEALIEKIKDNDFETIRKLRHDEHIDAAIKAGLIEKALVYSINRYRSKPNRVHLIDGGEIYANEPIIINTSFDDNADTVIEAKNLENSFQKFDEILKRNIWLKNFILDIDLDFFRTCKSLHPENVSFFKKILDKSKAISIAKESVYVNQWKKKYDRKISVDYILKHLIELIKK